MEWPAGPLLLSERGPHDASFSQVLWETRDRAITGVSTQGVAADS
jgi:hypothetical protein